MFDMYHRSSCKRQTRESRGKKSGARIPMKASTQVIQNLILPKSAAVFIQQYFQNDQKT